MWYKDEKQVKFWYVIPLKAGGPKSKRKSDDLLHEQDQKSMR